MVRPTLTDCIALAKAAQLRDFSVLYSCCCILLLLHLAGWVSATADPCLLSAHDIVGTVYMATLQKTQRAKSDSDVKIMYGFPLPTPTPARPAPQ